MTFCDTARPRFVPSFSSPSPSPHPASHCRPATHFADTLRPFSRCIIAHSVGPPPRRGTTSLRHASARHHSCPTLPDRIIMFVSLRAWTARCQTVAANLWVYPMTRKWATRQNRRELHCRPRRKPVTVLLFCMDSMRGAHNRDMRACIARRQTIAAKHFGCTL